jgi:hypothetical protein|tara:strand:+ start:892 stop:1152 length:261 start_codon:yes stop_codon:yes gene_type:complete
MSKVTVDSGILDEKEFTQVKKEQDKVNSILAEIGYIESKKHALLHELADTNEVVNNTKKVLEEKYGSISIDLLTGKWKRVNDKEDV